MSATMQRGTLTAASLGLPVPPPPPPPARKLNGSTLTLAAKSLKVTAVLDPAALAGVFVSAALARVTLRITISGVVVTASIKAQSMKRAVNTIREFGVENVAAIVQGKLAGNAIEEAGLVVQQKTPKPAAENATT
jgi:hypothetical protein